MKALAILAVLALCGCPEHTVRKLDLSSRAADPTVVASRGRSLRCATPRPVRPTAGRPPRA